MARRVWKRVREKETSNKHLPARTALARWSFAATQGRGVVSWQNQEQLPRFQGLTGATAAEQLPFINSGPSRDSSRSLSWCQSPLQRITCSNHRDGLLHACGTDSSIDFPGAAPQRKAHDPSCAMLLVSIISAAAGR